VGAYTNEEFGYNSSDNSELTEKSSSAEPSPQPEPGASTPKGAKGNPVKKVRKTSASSPLDLCAPDLYLNRELTWLAFNQRVLNEGLDERTPLLERVKFTAITGSNLDEFFMKRIGGLKQQKGARVLERTPDGRTPQEQIEQCYAVIRDHQKEKQSLLNHLKELLKKEGIVIIDYERLSARERKEVRDDYSRNIFPLVTPQSIDPAHPFPFISNLSLNLLVNLRYPEDKELSLARVKVPISAGAPRLMRVGDGDKFVLLEEVMASNLDMIFPGMEVVACEFFRVTRNANTEKSQEHADDLLALIESALQERKFAPIVRLEVKTGMDPVRRGRLAAELALNDEEDVFEVEGMMGMRDLFPLADLDYPHLKVPPHHPIDHPALQSERNIFHIIREAGSILLQHPYESFATSVERFLKEAATDPKVLGIKMTLYRTSSHSRIVETLIRAAQNGKQVAVVVELMARFDEEANIRLASRMEEGGVHVTYGVVGLKTHSKVILVVRRDYSGLRRYMHFGTGNYNATTSRIYSDFGLLTCDEDLGNDATEFFNYLTTGYTPKRNYRKMLPAPKILKKALLEKIQREIGHHSEKRPGHIQFKMNDLEDVDIVRALYEASRAGVRVDLIIRDSCRLRPGLPGISENIRVISIVGQFLEHARFFYFGHGGNEEYLIGSADAMQRNLEHRVEVVVPVEDPQLQLDLRVFFDIQWHNRRSAWEMEGDGSYRQRHPVQGEEARTCHQLLIELAEKRNKDVTRLKKRKAKGFAGRNLR
jgi:polyphosphate kinase